MKALLSATTASAFVLACAGPASNPDRAGERGDSGPAGGWSSPAAVDSSRRVVADYVYVTAESADQVCLVRFDREAGAAEVIDRIEVGYMATEIEGPHGLTVSPDGEHWYLSMAHGKPWGILYKYRTGSNEPIGQVELGLFPATMQISEASGLLYCVNFDLHGDMKPSSISIVDPDEMVEVARTTTGPMPHGSRISPNGRWHYSCAMMSGELFEIDALGFEIRRVLDLDGDGEHRHDDAVVDPTGGDELSKPTWVTPHPSAPRVYVALNAANEVVEVDVIDWKVTRRFPTDKAPYNLDLTRDGSLMVVTYKGAQSIGVWDLESGVQLAQLPTSRRVTHGVVISPDGRYAFVSSEGIGGEMGTLDVFDLVDLTGVCTVEIGLQAGGIAFWKSDSR